MRHWSAKATSESFNRRYEDNMGKAKSYKKAYEMTEQDHEEDFGERKYSDYESFRITRGKYLKKNK